MTLIDSRPAAPDLAGLSAPTREAPPAPPVDPETPEQVRSLFQMIGSVVAPTTMLTALLFYFGWAYSATFFEHFGLHISVMGLTTQDYLMNSVQALFVPMAVSFSAGLLIVWVHTRLKVRFFVGPHARRRLRLAAGAAGLSGLVLFGIGMAGIFVFTDQARLSLRFPLSFGAGVTLLAYASRLHARSERFHGAAAGAGSTALVELAVAFLLVSLSLLWTATNYAAAVGETRARQFASELRSRPEAILYSKEPLYLDAPGVRETSCGEAAGGYRFRYEGLRLMIESAGHYFFLPASWSSAGAAAIVVPDNDAVRMQFAVGPAGGRRQAPTANLTCPSPPPVP